MTMNKRMMVISGMTLIALSTGSLLAMGEKPKEGQDTDQTKTSEAAVQNSSPVTTPAVDKFSTFTSSIISYLNNELGTKNTLAVKNADGSAMDVPYDLKITGVDKGYTAAKDADTYFTLAHFKLIEKDGKRTLYTFEVYAQYKDGKWNITQVLNHN